VPEQAPSSKIETETVPSRRGDWGYWRGSPELLAQVARVAQRCATRDANRPECLIVVEVAGDRELFSSPSEFVQNVTREALRRFKRIEIVTKSEFINIQVALAWRRPWWKPGFGSDAEVILIVRGTSELEVEATFNQMRAAIKRGGTDGAVPLALVTNTVIVLTVTAVVAGTISALYLLGQSEQTIELASVGVGLLGFVIGALWGTWEYPALEVAPPGQTNLWRAVKFIGPLVGSAVVAGGAKALFG